MAEISIQQKFTPFTNPLYTIYKNTATILYVFRPEKQRPYKALLFLEIIHYSRIIRNISRIAWLWRIRIL